MVGVSVVSHADAGANSVIHRYLEAFADCSSIAVVAPARVDAVRRQPWLADWHVTDCTSQFELSRGGAASGDDELVFETSGTVRDSKMVRYRKSVIHDCATTIARRLRLDPDRDYISLANPRFAYGLSILHSHFIAGVPVHFLPPPVAVETCAALRDRLRPNSSVYLVPQHSYLLAQDASWRVDGPIELIFAGAAVTQPMVDLLKTSFPDAKITNMYGQAELGPRVSTCSTRIDDFHEGDVGQPLPGVDVQIDARSETRGAGIILVDSPFRMTRYVTMSGAGSAETTAWWATGDTGYLSDDGHLHVLGRSADDINFLGARMHLREMQEVVRAVPGVLDTRVAAVPHQVYGQRPSVRVLVNAQDDSMEPAVRKALGNAIGSGAGAVLITIVDLASLPESGKL